MLTIQLINKKKTLYFMVKTTIHADKKPVLKSLSLIKNSSVILLPEAF